MREEAGKEKGKQGRKEGYKEGREDEGVVGKRFKER